MLENLEDEFFLGRRCVSGDDGRLTWLVLASGYKTVYQSTARALSMFPDTFRAFFKQRVRWSRNSYRTYLTAMWKGWLWRQPFITQVTVLQILLTPVTMGFAVSYLVAWVAAPAEAGRDRRRRPGCCSAVASAGYSHLRQRPSDIFVLPLVAALTMIIALPIKSYALLTMNRHGWLTRNADQIGGDGQSAASLPAARTRPMTDRDIRGDR